MLLAGPGTGKTTSIKHLIDDEFGSAQRILVLSFTNATVNDLSSSFADSQHVRCYTLHSFALKINHLTDYYILESSREAPCLRKLAQDLDLDFGFLCRQLRCITFDAMISECLSFLRTNPVYGQDQIGILDLLVVDEYQDFNLVERELVDAIASYAGETIILGDDDQSIYGFKDADPDGIIQLYRRDDVHKIEHANNCYRCPDSVVNCAINLIRNNRNRVDKPWHATGRDGECTHRQCRTQSDSNEYIASEIERVKAQDHLNGDDNSTGILVLSPVRFYVDELVVILEDRGIEVVDFWKQAIDPEDYRRIWWIRAILSTRRLPNLIFLSRNLTPHFRKKFRAALGKGLQEGSTLQAILADVQPMFDAALAAFLENRPELEELAEAVPEFAALIARVDSTDLETSLDRLLRDANPAKEFTSGAVNLMSIHKSKGLQADVVFVTGLVDGVLPNSDEGVDTIEAQRRLLFVGITRAIRSLHLVSTVEWDGAVVHKVDKSQFKYSPRSRNYKATTSKFVIEMEQTDLSNQDLHLPAASRLQVTPGVSTRRQA
jgi:superfamily I DNA/RNA helicase